MVLCTHAFVGGVLAASVGADPASALAIGAISHFVLDAIPHWDYFGFLRSAKPDRENFLNTDMEVGRHFFRDLLILGGDVLVGVIFLSLIVLGKEHLWLAASLGALGGLLPDAMHFVYFKIRKEPFRSLERFHHFIHADESDFKMKKGLTLQLFIVIIFASFLLW